MSDFYVTRNYTVAASDLTSNVPDAPPSEWLSGTTYAEDALVSVFGGTSNTEAAVYISLIAGNNGNDPATSPTEWAFVCTMYKQWNNGTVYGLGARVLEDRQWWDSTIASNSNKRPGTAAGRTAWSRVSESNRWKMFGPSPGERTEWRQLIDVSINTVGVINSVGLVSVNASTARLIMTEDGLIIYDRLVSLIDNSMITNWFSYFFEPIRYLRDYTFLDLPTGFSPTISLTLTGGDTVYLGRAVVGDKLRLGITLAPATLASTDYSDIVQDDFGSAPYITQRRSTKRNDFMFACDEVDADWIYDFLIEQNGSPVLVSPANKPAMIVWGLLRDWSMDRPGGTAKAVVSMNVRGF